MKTPIDFFLPLVACSITIATGCTNNNSVKDNAGDNMHQEDTQDKTLNRVDTVKYPSDSNKFPSTPDRK